MLFFVLYNVDFYAEEERKGVKLLARNNNWDKGRIEGEEGGVVKEKSQFIELSLGICADGYGGPSHVTINQRKGTPPITANQLHELNQQALIFKYIVAGTPVPFPLVFPIWKSVASSFGSVNGGIYNQFPSCKWVSRNICMFHLFLFSSSRVWSKISDGCLFI